MKLRIQYARLLGLYEQDKLLITIDPRQSPKEQLDTLIHELLHHILPEMEEKEVEQLANLLAVVLWRQGYRKQK